MLTATVSAIGALTAVTGTAHAAPRTATNARPVGTADRALGNGLGRLLAAPTAGPKVAGGRLRIDQDAVTIRDARGRVLIDVTPRAGVDAAAFRRQAAALGLRVAATDATVGTLEGYAPLSAIRSLASLPGLGTIRQALRPVTSIGAATSQGVAFQRADKVQQRGIDGRGITIGALSDSYDTAAFTHHGTSLTDHAADDVASGDLPGVGNHQYPQPVVVVADNPGGALGYAFDEGRAMLQIAHDVAPASKLCFATGTAGDVGFADNIRRLADPNGPCRANVEVDDTGYFGEPMFSDGPIAAAIDEVAAEGVSYFSSAGNQGDRSAWDADVNLVRAARGLKGTNLDFSDVPPALYSGGLQDMNPGPGVDVAQSLTLGQNGGLLDLQWNDPVDANGPQLGDPYYTASGALSTATPSVSYSFTPTAAQLNQLVRFRTDGVPSGSTDLILDVTKPDGTELGPVDTGTSPEVIDTTLDQPGTYTITISGYNGATGPYTVEVRPVIARSKETDDFNVLLFSNDGTYLGALDDDNTLTGQPAEIAPLSGVSSLQLVISRSDTGPLGATKLRYVLFGDIAQDEYADPLATAELGHSSASGAAAVAAYDPFRPYLPEPYTSPGGEIPIYFDENGNRYPRVQYRQKPDLASTDDINTTFFVDDSPRDADTQPNFWGTSAAAPHAAAIAALLLQRAGGPGSLTPNQVRHRLQATAFAHDLDPNHAAGTAAGLIISADGPQGSENDLLSGSMTDPRFFTVRYTGRVPLRSITFYGETASPTALGTTHPPLSDGIVFDPRPNAGISPFGNQGFPFTVGSTAGGLSPSSVSASYAVPYGTAGQYRHLTVSFRNGLRGGAGFQFGVDRDLAVSGYPGGSNEGNGADELGGAVLPPQRLVDPIGLAFSAVRVDGTVLRGFLINRLGHGWSPLDGYGLIDAEAAVLGR